MRFDPSGLDRALACIPVDAWSLPSTIETTGVHHGYRRVVLADGRNRYPEAGPFGFVLDRLEPVFSAWLSWIDPGGFIRPHRDAGPYRERWQVPVVPAGWFRQGDATFVPEAGVAFRVAHWERHEVGNPTAGPRVHVVIDRDVWASPEPGPFRLED